MKEDESHKSNKFWGIINKSTASEESLNFEPLGDRDGSMVSSRSYNGKKQITIDDAFEMSGGFGRH